MKRFNSFLLVGVFLIFCSVVSADIPKQINFQGILKDSLGSPYPDGNYSLTFRIYDAASGGNILWQEADVFAVSGGLVTHLMGSIIAIPETVFEDSLRWLGIQVGSNPEITPRRQLVSVPYSYVADLAQSADKLGSLTPADVALANHNHVAQYAALSHSHTITSVDIQNGTIVDADVSATANIAPSKISGNAWTSANDGTGSGLNADSLDGMDASAFLNSSSDYGRSGVATDLYEGASTLSSKYVNVTGPDSVVTTSGTAFYGKSAGNSASDIIGVKGFGQNTGSGAAYGGRFEAPSAGTGNTFGVYSTATGFTAGPTYGSYGSANNNSTGNVYGGFFGTGPSGTGAHYAIYGSAFGNSANPTNGIYCFADNTSSGSVYGAYFQTSANGTGTHYGVRGDATGSSANPTYGCLSQVSNSSSGNVYGGYFFASSGGTGTHYGVYGIETAGGSGAAVYAAGDMIASGAKPAVVKTTKGHRLLYAMESPEIWFEDFGEGQLVNGNAHIELDPLFLETVTINGLNPMKVFIQLNDPDCKGTAVVRGTTGFDVIELQNGTSNASFSYRIVAKRKGYENQRLLQTTVGMDDPNLYPELWQEMEKRHEEAKVQLKLEE